MPTDLSLPLSVIEKAVYGAGAVRHPVTGIPLERGSGALPANQQARNLLAVITQQEGKAVAAEVRRRLDEFEAGRGVVNMPAPAPAAAPAAVFEFKRTERSTSAEQSIGG